MMVTYEHLKELLHYDPPKKPRTSSQNREKGRVMA